MKGRRVPYTAKEMEWLKDNSQLSIRDYHFQFVFAFGRDDVSPEQLNALRKRKRWQTGRTGRFAPGHTPHNKGLPFSPKGSEKGRFKKGQRTGAAARNWKPVGTERINYDGYLERKIHEGMPLQSRWRMVHLLRWEELHGPLPAGHCLKCLDGDRLNTDPANWKCIPRSLLPRLNGGTRKRHLAYDDAEPAVKPTVLAIAQLDHRARQARKVRA